MDTNLLPKTDIKDFIAYPKDWQREGKHNRPRPFKQYPLMPLIVGKGGKLVPIYLDREGLRPLTFANAREETEYLRANPDMAQKISEARAQQQSPSDKLEASNESMRKLAEKHKEVVAERNAMEGENADLRDQLARAQAELEAARAQSRGATRQVRSEGGEETAQDAPAPKKRGRKSRAEILAAQQNG